MLRLFIKSEGTLSAIKTAGREMDGVYHLEQDINGSKWSIVVRDDGVGVMAPKHKSLLMIMRDHLLFREAWGV